MQINLQEKQIEQNLNEFKTDFFMDIFNISPQKNENKKPAKKNRNFISFS